MFPSGPNDIVTADVSPVAGCAICFDTSSLVLVHHDSRIDKFDYLLVDV